MAAPTAAPSYRSSAGLRTAAQGQLSNIPPSPHTPNRTYTSAFSSPSTSLRTDDECLIFEFGTRHMRAGFSGDAAPRCVLGFGPDEQRRVGDFRQWEIGYEDSWRRRKRRNEWSEPHELWRADLRGVDLGLVEDKIERVVRTAYTKYLLTDSKPRRVLLALKPGLPHGLLSALLTTFFTNFQCPSITLISAPVLTTVAAGLRSALVVDIGWHETLVTGVYEFREISEKRSIRAGKMLAHEMGKLLTEDIRSATPENRRSRSTVEHIEGRDFDTNQVSFEECEDVIARMGWCRQSRRKATTSDRDDTPTPESSKERSSGSHSDDRIIDVELLSADPPTTLHLPFSRLSTPTEHTFFPDATPVPATVQDSKSDDPQPFDDSELPLSELTYQALLSLPIDVRRTCLCRIVVTGGGSTIPGLRSRLLSELKYLIEQRGWDRVRGPKHTLPARQRSLLHDASEGPPSQVENKMENATPIPVAQRDPIPDEITTMLQSRTSPSTDDSPAPKAAESLGAWAGASLVAGLRVKGAVEIEREKYVNSGGVAGASWTKLGEQGPTGSKPETLKTPARGVLAGKTPGGGGIGGAGSGSGTVGGDKAGGWSLGAWG
ncbi:MAG: hypothetical protein M4579_000932 [Chaenotheca gracillima]|nr:MAG: hypothetical protein M4579_000932 [Chaenotheca gracillima]